MGTNEKTLLGGPPHFVLPRAPTSLNPALGVVNFFDALANTTYLVFELMTVYDVAYPLVFWNMTLGLYFKQAER